MKTFFSSKVLSAALIAAAFAAAGSVPASAQSLSRDGSLMPHYFDKSGELKWGGWAPARQSIRPRLRRIASISMRGRRRIARMFADRRR